MSSDLLERHPDLRSRMRHDLDRLPRGEGCRSGCRRGEVIQKYVKLAQDRERVLSLNRRA